jgi:hypothetical protein
MLRILIAIVTYSHPLVKWACRAEGRASQWGKAWIS